MNELTPEQKAQISNWVVQRDALLLEISQLKTEKEKLAKSNTDLAISSSEIETRIQKSLGRIEELDKKEKEYEEIVDLKIVDLEKNKTRLETIITSKESEVVELDEKKDKLVKDIEFLTKVHETVFAEIPKMKDIISHVGEVNVTNIKDIEKVMDLVKTKSEEIIKLSTEDIQAQKNILGEIPKLFVELRRKSLEREIIITHKK